MQSDKPAHARNVPTKTGSGADLSRGQVSPDQVAQESGGPARDAKNAPPSQPEASRLATEARLKAEADSRPVAGTTSRPYIDEPGQPLRDRTKSRDPSDSAAQTRSAPPADPTPKLRSQ